MLVELLPYDQVIRHPAASDEFSPGYGFESKWAECSVYGPSSLEELADITQALIAEDAGHSFHIVQDSGAYI